MRRKRGQSGESVNEAAAGEAPTQGAAKRAKVAELEEAPKQREAAYRQDVNQ